MLLNIQKQQSYGSLRKIAEFTEGSNEIGTTQTQLQYCAAALDLCHKLTAGCIVPVVQGAR